MGWGPEVTAHVSLDNKRPTRSTQRLCRGVVQKSYAGVNGTAGGKELGEWSDNTARFEWWWWQRAKLCACSAAPRGRKPGGMQVSARVQCMDRPGGTPKEWAQRTERPGSVGA